MEQSQAKTTQCLRGHESWPDPITRLWGDLENVQKSVFSVCTWVLSETFLIYSVTHGYHLLHFKTSFVLCVLCMLIVLWV